MKSLILTVYLSLSDTPSSKKSSEKTLIETIINNYIDAFYKGDMKKLKAVIKPRLNKISYW
jgi:hypothetical protein